MFIHVALAVNMYIVAAKGWASSAKDLDNNHMLKQDTRCFWAFFSSKFNYLDGA